MPGMYHDHKQLDNAITELLNVTPTDCVHDADALGAQRFMDASVQYSIVCTT